MNGVDD
jgi:hypothetical protein